MHPEELRHAHCSIRLAGPAGYIHAENSERAGLFCILGATGLGAWAGTCQPGGCPGCLWQAGGSFTPTNTGRPIGLGCPIRTMQEAVTTRHARQMLSDLTTRYGLEVIDPPVNKSVRFAESPSRGMSIFQHAPSSPGAKAYSAIAEQIMKR